MEIFSILHKIRSAIWLFVKPATGYWTATKSLHPLSTKFGYDRGVPIDRFWVESFLSQNSAVIKGKCLEVTDSTYTKKYGGDKVISADVVDIDPKNKKANIHADLRRLSTVKSHIYDCIILTHVLGLIDDFDAAIRECHRVLKPGGVLLATSACFSPTYDLHSNYWRFTVTGFKYAFGKYFPADKLVVSSYGNVLAGQCFWIGMAQGELTEAQLTYNDPKFPCIVTARATKGK